MLYSQVRFKNSCIDFCMYVHNCAHYYTCWLPILRQDTPCMTVVIVTGRDILV